MNSPNEPAPPPIQRPGLRLRLTQDYARGAKQLGLDRVGGVAKALRESPGLPGGRGENFLLESPAWPGAIRVRPMRRGGWLGPLLGERFSSPRRAEREFEIWQTLREAGAPVPPIALAAAERRGLFWALFIGAEQRDQAIPFGRLIQEQADDPEALCAWALAAGTAVRRFHDAGALHGDLHTGNLLAEAGSKAIHTPGAGGPHSRPARRVWLVDLDRAVLCPPRTPGPAPTPDPNALLAAAPVSDPASEPKSRIGSRAPARPTPRQRMRELGRLDRSLLKTAPAAARQPRVRAAFLAGYCQGDRSLRRALLTHWPREQRRTWLHRLGWAVLPSRRGAPYAQDGSSRSTTLLSTAFLFLLAGVSGCDATAPLANAAATSPRFSLLAAGDTGSTRPFPDLFEGQRAVSRAMEREDEQRPVDGIVLLGDNFYWEGLSPEDFETRVITNLIEPYCRFFEFRGALADTFSRHCRRGAGARHPVPFYAVLGNHDIEAPESARLQRVEIPKSLPNWRMSPGLAATIELGEGISLVLFESELAIDDPKRMKAALQTALEASQGPWRILALHRPIVTDDEGGVPIGGYPAWVQEAMASSGQPVQLVLAGHHHSLQAIRLPAPLGGLHIGAGSGSRSDPPLAKDHPDALFGALSLGFARIDLFGEGKKERLVVSLIGTARWPFLSAVRRPETLARFEISRAGAVSRGTSD